jgi:hypothetical protein
LVRSTTHRHFERSEKSLFAFPALVDAGLQPGIFFVAQTFLPVRFASPATSDRDFASVSKKLDLLRTT